MAYMPYAPSPFSAIPYASMVQSAPLHQALGPLSQMQQGPGGQFGQSPFAYLPPQQQQAPQPVFGGSHGAMGGGFAAMGGVNPIRPSNWALPSPGVYSPGAQNSAMMNFPSQVAGGAMGAGFGVARAAGGAVSANLAMQVAKGMVFNGGLTGAASAMGGGISGALGASSVMGAGAHLAGGAGGAAGALFGSAAMPLMGLGGMYAAGKGMQYAGQGVTNLRDTYAGLNKGMGNFAGLPGAGVTGRGVGYGQGSDINQALQTTGSQQFRRFDQASENMQGLASSGQLTVGAKGAGDMKRNLLKAFDTMGELMEVMNTTFDEAGKMFENIRRMGITNQSSMLSYAMKARVGGGVAGVSNDQMLQVGAGGAAQARQMGGYGAGGAALATGLTTSVGGALRSGSLSEENMREITGGSLDPTEAARKISGGIMGYMQGQGQHLVAGLMTPGGGINKRALRNASSGKMGFQGVINRGVGNMQGDMGLDFVANRQKLTSDLFEESGSEMTGLIYQQAKSMAQMMPGGSSKQNMQMILQRTMKLDEATTKGVMEMGNEEAQYKTQQLEGAAKNTIMGEKLRRTQIGFGAAWERGVRSPLAQWGTENIQNPMTRMAGAVGEFGEKALRASYGFGALADESYGEMYSPMVQEDIIHGDLRERASAARSGGPAGGRGRSRGLTKAIADYSWGTSTTDPSTGEFWAAQLGKLGGRGDLDGAGVSAEEMAGAVDMAQSMEGIKGMGSIFGKRLMDVRESLSENAIGDTFKQAQLVKEGMGVNNQLNQGNADSLVKEYMSNFSGDSNAQVELLKSINGFLKEDVKLSDEQLKSTKATEMLQSRLSAQPGGAQSAATAMGVLGGQDVARGITGTSGFGLAGLGGILPRLTGERDPYRAAMEQTMDRGAVRGANRRSAPSARDDLMRGQPSLGGMSGIGGLMETTGEWLDTAWAYWAGADNDAIDQATALSRASGGAVGDLMSAYRARGSDFSDDDMMKDIKHQLTANPELLNELERDYPNLEIGRVLSGDTTVDQGKIDGVKKALKDRKNRGSQASDRSMRGYVSGATRGVSSYLEATGRTLDKIGTLRKGGKGSKAAMNADVRAVMGGQDVSRIAGGKSGDLKQAYAQSYGTMNAAIEDLMEGGIQGEGEWEGLMALGGSKQGAEAFQERLGRLHQKSKKGDISNAVSRLAAESGITGKAGISDLMKQIKSGSMDRTKMREMYGNLMAAGEGGAGGGSMGGVDVAGLGKVVDSFSTAVTALTTGIEAGEVVQATTTVDENVTPPASGKRGRTRQ